MLSSRSSHVSVTLSLWHYSNEMVQILFDGWHVGISTVIFSGRGAINMEHISEELPSWCGAYTWHPASRFYGRLVFASCPHSLQEYCTMSNKVKAMGQTT